MQLSEDLPERQGAMDWEPLRAATMKLLERAVNVADSVEASA